jgi:hypothetical protein
MPTRRHVLVHTGLAAALVAGGFAAGMATDDTSAHRPSRPGDQASLDDPAPRRAGGDVSARSARTRSGAVAAASDAVALLGDPRALRPAGRAQILNVVAADGARPRLAERLAVPAAVEEATGLTADLAAGRPVVARVVPVASRLVAYRGGAATVEVWVVAVLGTGRLGVVTGSWSTETLRLVWERGGWRVGGYTSRSGPVPAVTQPPTPFTDAAAATERMRGHTDALAR